MDDDFGPAATAIFIGDLDELAHLLADDPGLATRQSSVSHPTLLQLVACEEPKIVDAVGAARILIDAGAPTALPLVAAAGCDSRGVLEFMLESGIDVHGDASWSALDEALYWSNAETASVLIQRGASIRALSTAAGLGDPSAIDEFFDGDAVKPSAGPIGSPFADTVPRQLANDTQSILNHAFVMAVNNGQRETADALRRRGALIDATPPGYHWRGTALHAAVWRGHRELVEWLLSLGADPSIRDGLARSDAAGWARHHGHMELLDVFDAVPPSTE